jgi:hypothetical protein
MAFGWIDDFPHRLNATIMAKSLGTEELISGARKVLNKAS